MVTISPHLAHQSFLFLFCQFVPTFKFTVQSFQRLLLSKWIKFLIKIPFKDGAYYCYCAYVLRISRYSNFLSVMLTNTGIFLRGLKLSGKSIS